jgi:small nuclear ribonucleoprotein G
MVNLQGKRKVSGVLRGYDIFLNLVLDDAVDETSNTDKPKLSTMVRPGSLC